MVHLVSRFRNLRGSRSLRIQATHPTGVHLRGDDPLTSSPEGLDPLPPAAVRSLLQDTRVLTYLRISREGAVMDANRVFSRWTGLPRSDLLGQPIQRVLTEEDRPRMERWLEGHDPLPDEAFLLNFVSTSHDVQTLSCRLFAHHGDVVLLGEPDLEEDRTVAEELLMLNNELSVLSRENARRNRELETARRELADALAERESSYWHLRKIQEHMPLCMRCGKMKTGDAEWESLVDYLRSNDILVSHGYCPTCADDVLQEEGVIG